MANIQLCYAHNKETLLLKNIPNVSIGDFRNTLINEVNQGARIANLFGKQVSDKTIRIFAVLAYDSKGIMSLMSSDIENEYPSITPECPQAHWFEREIREQWDIIPKGHPWLKPIRFQKSYLTRNITEEKPILPSVTDFFKVSGEEIHEVAVGPVHAGIIEPGHFRFQCNGENVFNLEISLGYQHRGIEKVLIGGPSKRTISYMETLAGDTTIGHTIAYCQTIEALSNRTISLRAQSLRGIALELERLANHTGDLGAIANDIAYLPTASYLGRIRGDFLNMAALICGSRFGHGMIRPGGTGFDIDNNIIAQLQERIDNALKDLTSAVNLLWDSSTVLDRLDGTGIISKNTCRDLGIVGVAARACGIEQDVRFDFPYGIYRFTQIPVATYPSGDVFARAYVRFLEIQRSIEFIKSQLKTLPGGKIKIELEPLAANAITVSLVEGWRGEICHVAMTDKHGNFSHYKVVDPSFHNWMGLAMAMRNEQISDFPLCNKSFNLSYCGHDL